MSWTPTDSERALWTWLDGCVSCTLIHEHQDAPRPATTFGSLLVISEDTVGHPSAELSDGASGADYVERGAQLVQLRARVTFYGAAAGARARELVGAWTLPSRAAAARELGLGLERLTPARRVPQVLGPNTEDRWVVELTANRVEGAEAASQALNTITATLDLSDPE